MSELKPYWCYAFQTDAHFDCLQLLFIHLFLILFLKAPYQVAHSITILTRLVLYLFMDQVREDSVTEHN